MEEFIENLNRYMFNQSPKTAGRLVLQKNVENTTIGAFKRFIWTLHFVHKKETYVLIKVQIEYRSVSDNDKKIIEKNLNTEMYKRIFELCFKNSNYFIQMIYGTFKGIQQISDASN